jgi:hypothetical protein
MSEEGEWTIRSSAGQGDLLALAVGAVGGTLMFLAHGGAQDRNGRAAYWLGCLLLAASVGHLVWAEDIVLTVDPRRRVLIFRKKNRWSTTETVVPFGDVSTVDVSRIGRTGNGMETYHLALILKSGDRFRTGKWSLDQSEIASIAEELARTLGCQLQAGVRVYPVGLERSLLAGVGAVGLYALWFRATVGPWCAAMWFGTAPPVLIMIFFFSLRTLLRYFPD